MGKKGEGRAVTGGTGERADAMLKRRWDWLDYDAAELDVPGRYRKAYKAAWYGLSAVAVASLSFIGGPDAGPFGFSTYEQGAAALAIALVGLSMAWVRVGEKPIWPALAWFASVVAVGLLGMIEPLAPYGMPAAGILFGLGFVLAGLPLVGVSVGRAAR